MISNAEHDEILELIPAYALDILDVEEAERVGRHLTNCEICQAELAAYEPVVGLMALGTPDAEPSPALRERLLVQTGPGQPRSAVAGSPHAPTGGRKTGQQIGETIRNWLAGPHWRPAALAMIVLLLISSVLLWQQFKMTETTEGWTEIHLYGSEAVGIIYISADGRNGTLIVDGLPPLPAVQQYQLWLIQGERRDSGAVFSVDEDGYRGIQIESAVALDEYSAFGITVEPAGGSPSPTGERILGYNLQS